MSQEMWNVIICKIQVEKNVENFEAPSTTFRSKPIFVVTNQDVLAWSTLIAK